LTALLTAADFAPHEALAADLLDHATEGDDGSHDLAHIHRVFKNALKIQAGEGGDPQILAAAVLLHDCVAVEKSSPLRSQASRLAVAHAILTHSFSANIQPETLEAKMLQDADRLDAIGMVGVARCFYIAGRMGSGLYHPGDPGAEHRPLDDRSYAIDHFPAKLMKLSGGFQTETGAKLAKERHERLSLFLSLFRDEI
jgi:uncharacterized protein